MTRIDLPSDKTALAAAIREQLAQVRALRDSIRADPSTAQDRTLLRAWQTERLANTYADLLRSERHRAAAEYFLNDLYGPKDFAQRDADVGRIIPAMTRMLPASALAAFALAMELDWLSERIDQQLARELRAQQDDPDAPLEIDATRYARAYRACANEAERERQIDLVGEIGRELDRLASKRLVAAAIDLMHGPARAAGLGELHEFLERGFRAFRIMRGADEFLQTIDRRERQINAQLFAGRARPFEINT